MRLQKPIRLNKTNIENLPVPNDTPAFYRDDKLKGFGVKIFTSGTKSFFLEKKISGKSKRITIGSFGELTAEQARKQAEKLAGQIASGIDPVGEKREAKLKGVTLSQAFTDYLKARKDLKPKTLDDYGRAMTKAFPDWQDKPLLSITKDMVAKRHTRLGEQHGEAWANLSMKVLRAVFNFARGQYEDSQGRSLVPDNPVERLSQSRAWYRLERRKTHIEAQDLGAWFQGVLDLGNETLRDYLLLLVLTGFRKNEAATLTWDNVNLGSKTVTALNTKNHSDHTLPLSDYLHALLAKRKTEATGSYVFPGNGSGGYIVDPRKQMAKVTEATGLAFTVHDLRRTFITIAESLDIPAYALKRLLNHSSGGDITAGYIITDVERLREPMQKVTDFVLKSAGLKPTAEIVQINKPQKAIHS